MVAVARIGGIVSGVLGLLLAAGFVIVALFDLRGSNAARIVSWVLGGIGVLCFGCGALGQAGGSALANLQRGSANGVNVQEATRRIQEAVPAWVAPIAVTIVIINLHAFDVIEDTAAGIASAKTAGMQVIGLTTTYPAHELREADVIVRSCADIHVEVRAGDEDSLKLQFYFEYSPAEI